MIDAAVVSTATAAATRAIVRKVVLVVLIVVVRTTYLQGLQHIARSVVMLTARLYHLRRRGHAGGVEDHAITGTLVVILVIILVILVAADVVALRGNVSLPLHDDYNGERKKERRRDGVDSIKHKKDATIYSKCFQFWYFFLFFNTTTPHLLGKE